MTLTEYLRDNQITQTAAASELGVTQAHVAMLVAGTRRPSLALLRRIVALTDGKVGLDDFVGS